MEIDKDEKLIGKEPVANAPKRIGLIIWMVCAQVLMVVSLVFWLLVAGFSVMAFDSGVSAQAWTVVILVWSYPLFPIVISITSWITFAKRKNVLAGVLAGIAFAPPVLCFLTILIANTSWFMLNGR